jgi:hypothetical protein
VSSSTGLCVGPIRRPEESYQMLCGVECDDEDSIRRKLWPTGVCCNMGGGGTANLYPVKLNKFHMCLETA